MTSEALIEQAFALVPYPSSERLTTHRCLECDEIDQYFRGTTWPSHSVEELRLHAAALSLFTPEAFRYFLPAFMLATLQDPDRADVIPDSIAFHLAAGSNSDPAWVRERLVLLSSDQRDAVRAFFTELVSRGVLEAEEVREPLASL